jgi:thiol:disulfide interchange protein
MHIVRSVLTLIILASLLFQYRYLLIPEALAGDEDIHFFEGSIKEAVSEAKKDNKLVFIDVYATWCGPCIRMKKTSFRSVAVGQLYNQHFINIAIDGETPEGAKVIKQYGVQAYPTLLFIDAEGKLVGKSVGFQGEQSLLSIGQQALVQTR